MDDFLDEQFEDRLWFEGLEDLMDEDSRESSEDALEL